MNQNQLVSICIPTYNNGQYIGETLESLINQTYKNIEIIVSDNASTDNTKAIVSAKKSKDSRIYYFRNDENLGYVNNIKNAVSKAKSDIIAIYHSDDIYEPTIIEKELIQLLENDNVGAVFSAFASFNEQYSNKLEFSQLYDQLTAYSIYDCKKNIFFGGIKEYLPVITKHGNIFSCPSLMCKKQIYQDIGGYTDEYPTNEDFDLWLRLLKSGYNLLMLNEPLLHYRISSTQGSNISKKMTSLPMMYMVLNDFKKNNPQFFIDAKIIDNFNYLLGKGYCLTALNYLKRREFLPGCSYVIKSKKYYKFSVFSKVGIFQLFGSLFVSFYAMFKPGSKF
ncbi:MAG: glycosyltransferase family 2 protein [Desulfobacteraceae bacterium]|nr:glycosyltransferase family 2 protein [Desulfobacteraceae bacterium]